MCIGPLSPETAARAREKIPASPLSEVSRAAATGLRAERRPGEPSPG